MPFTAFWLVSRRQLTLWHLRHQMTPLLVSGMCPSGEAELEITQMQSRCVLEGEAPSSHYLSHRRRKASKESCLVAARNVRSSFCLFQVGWDRLVQLLGLVAFLNLLGGSLKLLKRAEQFLGADL